MTAMLRALNMRKRSNWAVDMSYGCAFKGEGLFGSSFSGLGKAHENNPEAVGHGSILIGRFRLTSGFKTLVEHASCYGRSVNFGGPIINTEGAQQSLNHGQWPIFRNTQCPGDLHSRVSHAVDGL